MLKTVGRAVELLAILGVSPDGLTLSEIAREMRSNKQAVFRLAKTLAAFHLVANNPQTGRLRLGAGLLRLADAIRPEFDLRQMALPALTNLKDVTGETACLHVMFGSDKRVCIHQVESDGEIRWTAEVGRPYPVTVGAPGKTFLAFISDRERERLLKRARLVRMTSSSIVDRERLAREIEKVRRDGYATARNELIPGMGSVAAPVFDENGRIIATVTLLGSSARLTSKKLSAYAVHVCDAAQQVSTALGHVSGRADFAKSGPIGPKLNGPANHRRPKPVRRHRTDSRTLRRPRR